MEKNLRVLNVEDSERDVALIHRYLARAGYTVIAERVDTPEAMRSAMQSAAWDVILCDYSMPKFSAFAALGVLKETGMDIPFIIISGTVGEDLAVEAMRAGAMDYLMKDNLIRLAPAIERELLEAANRRARRRVEAALRESEDRYRDLVEHSHDLICTHDLEGRVLSVNRTAAQSLGDDPEQLLGHNIRDILPPEFRDRFAHYIAQLLKEGVARGLMVAQTRKGERRIWEYRNTLRTEGVAEPIVRGMARDVTEQKRAEAALLESEQRYKGLIDAAFDGVVVLRNGIIRSANRAFAEMYGYQIEELPGRSLMELTLAEQHDLVVANMARREAQYEAVGIKKDGTYINIEVSASDCVYEGEPAHLAAVRDVSERKRAEEALRQSEEQLRQAQKMEAIGRLAGGVAHDFNNLLTAILGYSQMLLNRLDAADPMRQQVEEIKKAGDRAAGLTNQLLAFSRRQILQPRILNLNIVIADVSNMLKRLIGEDVELRTELDPAIGSVKADPGQIEQIIMNLAVNARDAMPKGGKLTIETQSLYLDESYASQHTEVQPGPHVLMAMSDTGIGMDRATQTRIFEPFFTTKEKGRGTGLGLSMVYGIIKQSNGHVWVYSEPGKGTTFKIYLPMVEEPFEAAAAFLPARSLQGTETILVVEDEEAVRHLACQILELYGYTVLEAADATTAIALFDEHREMIQLMLTDVVMPHTSGRELAGRLTPLRPGMKILYMSGYTENAIVHHGVLDAGTAFLQKPFTPDALARKVREMLDAP